MSAYGNLTMDEGVCLLPEEMLRTTTMLKKKYICPLYIWISSEPQDFMMASFSRCCQGDARQSRENIIQAAIPKAWLLIHSWSGRIRTPSSWFWLLCLHGHQVFRVKNVNFFFLSFLAVMHGDEMMYMNKIQLWRSGRTWNGEVLSSAQL